MIDLDAELLELMDGIEFSEDIESEIYNPSMTIENDHAGKVKIRIPDQESSFITSVESRLSGKKYRRSQFVKNARSDVQTYTRTDGLDYSDLWIKNNLQVKITPYGYRKDSIVACLWHRFLPSTEWQKIGILKLSGKKIFFSSIELNYIVPEIRIRILLLLKCYGLIPNEVVKDCNCSQKTTAILHSEKLQEKLNIRVSNGINPTMPYMLIDDLRDKKPCPDKVSYNTVDVHLYTPIGDQGKKIEELQNEVIKARNEARKAKQALIRANNDANRYQDERDTLISRTTPIDKPKPRKTFDLSR